MLVAIAFAGSVILAPASSPDLKALTGLDPNKAVAEASSLRSTINSLVADWLSRPDATCSDTAILAARSGSHTHRRN